MELVEEIKGSDYHVLIVRDVVRNIEQYDIEGWYNDAYHTRRFFQFPGKHNNFKLTQYDANAQVKEIGEQVSEDLNKIIPVPTECYVSSGMHELSWHESGTGAIPPHDDYNHFCGFTIFVNKYWDPQWGGWNMCLSNDEKRVVKITYPEYNTGVVVLNRTFHCAAPVYEDRRRRSLQYFITYEQNQN